MRNKIYVVGTGPGNPEQLTIAARGVIDSAGLVVAAKRHMPLAGGGRVIPLGKFGETFDIVDRELDKVSVAILVSGDTGVYSLLPLIKRRFPDEDISVLPGISSLQSLCAAVRETWIDAKITSGHGRDITEAHVLDAADRNAKTIFFCGPEWTPQRVCAALAENGLGGLTVTVGEHLSYPEQRVMTGSPEELAKTDFDDLSIMLIKNPEPWHMPASRPHDEDFIRTKVPMTREVVRGAILDALRLEGDSVVWDLGAGTGSVTVAAALVCDGGRVCAVERNPEAVGLINANCAKFHRHNVSVTLGDSLECMARLPKPTHVFIGGSGSELPELLERISALGGGIRTVVSAVAFKTYSAAFDGLSGSGYADFSACSVSVGNSKKIGSTHIMTANNPVTIFSAVTAQKEGI